MLQAKDIMTKEVFTADPEETLTDIVKCLLKNKISGMPVCDKDKRVMGMISERDILNFMFSGNLASTKVKEAMHTEVVSFPPDAHIDKISLAMGEKKIRRVPIVEDGKIVGIISRRSIIRTIV